MKKMILPLILAVSIVGMNTSCKKNNTKTTKDYLTGKWKQTQTADDNNGNGVMDANEEFTDTTNTYYTFNSDGTGTATTMFLSGVTSFPMTWSLLNNNTYVLVSIPAINTNNVSLHIDNINATNMTLKDTTGGIASWSVFVKQ